MNLRNQMLGQLMSRFSFPMAASAISFNGSTYAVMHLEQTAWLNMLVRGDERPFEVRRLDDNTKQLIKGWDRAAFMEQVNDHFHAWHSVYLEKWQAIMAASTKEELEAIDLTTGWPDDTANALQLS